jgi:hypothetical protein
MHKDCRNHFPNGPSRKRTLPCFALTGLFGEQPIHCSILTGPFRGKDPICNQCKELEECVVIRIIDKKTDDLEMHGMTSFKGFEISIKRIPQQG